MALSVNKRHACSTRLCLELAVVTFLAMLHTSTGQSTCTGFVGSRYCYTLHRDADTWETADAKCVAEGGHLASIYTQDEQTAIEQYLQDEVTGSRPIWTAGLQPDPESFWGNPTALWRYISECTGTCNITACNGGKLDIAFLVDDSGSISRDDWTITLGFINRLIDQFTIGPNDVQIAMGKFGNNAEVLFYLNTSSDKVEIKQKVNQTFHENHNTNTSAGLILLRTNIFNNITGGDRIEAPNVAIVITDGRSTYSNQTTAAEAKRLQDSGVQVFVIGVGPEIWKPEVIQISSPPQKENITYALVPSFRALENQTMIVEFAKSICRWQHMVNVVNESALFSQGCYGDNDAAPDLTYSFLLAGFPIDSNSCSVQCRQRGYRFAGTKIDLYIGQDTAICSCGNEFGRTGTTNMCTRACTGDSSKQCGGFRKNSIYKTNGVYGFWESPQPDNAQGDIQFCGAIDITSSDASTEGYGYGDERCSEQHYYICQLPATACSNPSVTFGSCVVVSSVKATWHAARRACQDQAGDLLVINNQQQNVELANNYNIPRSASDQWYWVGLYRESHFWMDGAVTEFKWMNYAPSEPNFRNGKCVYIDPSMNYKWRTGSCNAGKYFICQQARNYTKTTPVITTTPTPVSTTPATTTTPISATTSTHTASTSNTVTASKTVLVDSTTTAAKRTTEQVTQSGTKQAPVINELPKSTITTSTTTTTPTPSPTTTTTTTPPPVVNTTIDSETDTPANVPEVTTTDTGLSGPGAGEAATESDPWWKTYWWAILLALLLLLIIIIIIVVVLCCKKSKKRRRIYDARPIAPAPISTVLGDDEPYDFYIESSSQVDLVVGSDVHGVPRRKNWNRVVSSATGEDNDGFDSVTYDEKNYRNSTGPRNSTRQSVRKSYNGNRLVID